MQATAPELIRGSQLLATAFALARRAHEGPNGGETEIEHPVAVARLLDEAGFDEEVVAAALLHDVVEDTGEGLGEIRAACGERVAELVELLTEDSSIEAYGDRKAEHRERVLAAGSPAAAIYLADKLARVRRYARAGERFQPPRFDHFRKTLSLYAEQAPELPFAAKLARELLAVAPRDPAA